MKPFKQPDLSAPRFRPRKLNILTKEMYQDFSTRYPKYKHIPYEVYKEIVTKFNGKIWEEVIENRDGVELPEQLGYIFIGTCPRKISDNPNYQKSKIYGTKVQNQNWESDQYVAKIFYTNFEVKYRFRFHHMWGFTGLRDFKRTVAKTYPENWKKYPVIDNFQKISRLLRKVHKLDIMAAETELQLQDYDEFDLD